MKRKSWWKNIDVDGIKQFLIKYKVQVIAGIAVILLACISILVSYAFYQVTEEEKIIGGQVGEIPDLEVRIMAQNRDSSGKAISGYSIYPYIPKAGYVYNESKSYCANGSTINYSNYQANITAGGNDLCFLYFDSVANLDITLNVYAEDVDSNGEGTGNYTKLETTSLPSIGYTYNQAKSSCNNGSTLTYSDVDNMFTIEASGKDVCNAYMDAMDVDISLKIMVQAKQGSSTYYEAKSIPTNNYYVLGSQSSCTGSSTLSVVNQMVVISATSKTSCVAYLDVGTGPIPEQASLMRSSLSLTESNLGSQVSTWNYSTDGGETYNTASGDTATLNTDSANGVKYYGVDANGNESRIVDTQNSNYVYEGLFAYSSSVQTKTIEKTGYYKLETWGAQGGSFNANYGVGGKGGYSTGIVHLNAGDIIYVHVGGQGLFYAGSDATSVGAGGVNGGGNAGYRGGTGGGATDIRINEDSLYARVIVAGGGGGASSYSSTYKANGGPGGGINGLNGGYYSSSYAAFVGGGGTQTSGGKGGTGSSSNFNGNSGEFGVGGNTGYRYNDSAYYSNGAGGGGWYGGGAAGNYDGSDYNRAAGGGGGSGYVYTSATAQNYPEGCKLNESYYLTSASTIAGSSSFVNPSGISETGHSEDGYAKVTYIGESLE